MSGANIRGKIAVPWLAVVETCAQHAVESAINHPKLTRWKEAFPDYAGVFVYFRPEVLKDFAPSVSIQQTINVQVTSLEQTPPR